MDIYEITVLFYTMEEIWSYICNDHNFLFKSHELFAEDFSKFRDKFNKSLALMMRDYMYYAIMGELINSVRGCEECFSTILGSNSLYVSDRDLERDYKRIDPEDLLENANKLFIDSYWNGLFGGPTWGKAVDLTKLYGKVPDATFIDNLMDLQHNTDSVLSKKNPYWEVKLAQNKQLIILLNKKRNNKLWVSQNIRWVQRFPKTLKKLMLRFIALHIPEWEEKDKFLSAFHDHHSEKYFWDIVNYKPIEYTNEFVLGPICWSDDIYSEEIYY